MNWGLFESFCELLESIPIKAVLRAADAERRMVEDDLEKKRTEPDEYVRSVLSFCNFLALAVRGITTRIPKLPFEHRAFYDKIIQRLVDAGELPPEIKGCFEANIPETAKPRIRQNFPSLEHAAAHRAALRRNLDATA
ncbi:MAG TPA: hypothetical protein VN873_08585 [Candidatus Angelobacter sp.]|nr:hypothetical protein [Candidatus Angelobacter sp.]